MYVRALPDVCTCTTCVPGARRGPKRESDFLELDLEIISAWTTTLGPLQEQALFAA